MSLPHLMPDPDELAAEADKEAAQSWRMSRVWWWQLPFATAGYILTARLWPGGIVQDIMLAYLAGVSVIANAVSYAGKARAAEAKAAGYRNP
jgi:hypothetical protein